MQNMTYQLSIVLSILNFFAFACSLYECGDYSMLFLLNGSVLAVYSFIFKNDSKKTLWTKTDGY